MEGEQDKRTGLSRIFELGFDALAVIAALFAPPPPKQDAPPAVSGRDQDLTLESAASMQRRERWGTLFVLLAFAVAAGGGLGFVFAFWTDASNVLLGLCLALFFAGLGATAVLWARWLMEHKEAIEPREELSPPPGEESATAEAFCRGAHEVRRRNLLKWMGVGAAGILASMLISVMRSLGMSPDNSLFTRVWKRGQRLVTFDGKPMSLASLQPGSTVTVFPEDRIGSENAQTVLIRVKEHASPAGDSTGWAPGGYVAYSRVCTHAGCPVGQFEAETSTLLCPCHQSTFDVLRAATPTGGPAARPLPQLPIYADADGTLRAAGGFTAPPGPGFWGIS